MKLIDTLPAEAMTLVEAITAHVPNDEPAGEPAVIQAGTVLVTDRDERFALEVDAETGRGFVTRVRVTAPGETELTVWQDGRELLRRNQPVE